MDNKIIDKYMLSFLDEFQSIFDRLPTDQEYNLWKAGFVDGCRAIEEGVRNSLTNQ